MELFYHTANRVLHKHKFCSSLILPNDSLHWRPHSHWAICSRFMLRTCACVMQRRGHDLGAYTWDAEGLEEVMDIWIYFLSNVSTLNCMAASCTQALNIFVWPFLHFVYSNLFIFLFNHGGTENLFQRRFFKVNLVLNCFCWCEGKVLVMVLLYLL